MKIQRRGKGLGEGRSRLMERRRWFQEPQRVHQVGAEWMETTWWKRTLDIKGMEQSQEKLMKLGKGLENRAGKEQLAVFHPERRS